MKYILMSIARKATLLTFLLLGGITWFWYFFLQSRYPFIRTEFVLIMILISVLMALYFFVHYTINPLNIVLREIKSLLTGRKYNRIFTKRIDEIGVIAHFFNEITEALERASKDIKKQRRLSAELDIASKIQKDILPKEAPLVPGLNVLAKTRSAAEIGGDSFGFIEAHENTFIYIGDVTGHGVPSGLVMMMVDTLIDTFTDMYREADTILINTNKYLKPRINNTIFMTIVMFRWHHESKKMFMCGAGHEHIVTYKKSEKKCFAEKSGGIALGMIDDITKIACEREISFTEGDILVAYSDGITEAKNVHGEMYGLERLKKTVENCGIQNYTVTEIFKTIARDFSKFTQKHVQEDDMTLIIIKHKNPSDEHAFESTTWEDSDLGKTSLVDYS
ncbi:SpoIIE family protein phosphatase [Candidatus Peregrinibacteria bacterium]|nr:SpoIIE family protein phosphatase [Candidatus Peregrinibacteria bacterium]